MPMYMLVLAIITADGQETEWSVLDSGLTREECEAVLLTAPLPFSYHDAVVEYSCQRVDASL